MLSNSYWESSIGWLVQHLNNATSWSIFLALCAGALIFLDIFARNWNGKLSRFFAVMWKVIESSSWVRIPENLIRYYLYLAGGLYRGLTLLIGSEKGVLFLVFLTPIMNWFVFTLLGFAVVWWQLVLYSSLPWGMAYIAVRFSPYAQMVIKLLLAKEVADEDLTSEVEKIDHFCLATGESPERVTTEKREYVKRSLAEIERQIETISPKIWIYNGMAILRPIVVITCIYLLFSPVQARFWDLDTRGALLVTACLLPTTFLLVEVISSLTGWAVAARTFGKVPLSDAYAKSVRSVHWSANFSLGFALSLLVTFLALDVGAIVEVDQQISPSPRFLLVNFICDGATLWFTVLVMRWAVAGNTLLRIPLAIVKDVVFAAVLAVTSLYLGLLGSSSEISLEVAVNILTANYFNFDEAKYGSLFWVMHTTFLPTLLYCLLIAFGWLGKLVLLLWVVFFQRGIEDRPLALTGSVLAALAGVVQGFVYFI